MSHQMTRRHALTAIAAGTAGAAALARVSAADAPSPALQPPATPSSAAPQPPSVGPLVLPALPYDKASLEPHIDTETMEIHHDRHHKAYVDNANKALAGTKWVDMPAEKIVASLSDLPDDKRMVIRNNVGGHLNHSWFWASMAPPAKGGGGEPTGTLADAMKAAFGSFAGESGFKDKFAAAATTRFGSGWAWLCLMPDSKLAICSTPNQDNPLMGDKIAGCGGTPLLGLDVWEHAYYLKYRNMRANYIKEWWNVVNWTAIQSRFGGQSEMNK